MHSKVIPVWLVLLSGLVAVVARAQDHNLPTELQNVSFEKPSLVSGAEAGSRPDSWFHFSSVPEVNIAVTESRRKDGLQSVVLKAQKEIESYAGIAQRFAAIPGQHYAFSVFVMNDPQDPIAGDAFGQISLEWQDENGREVSRSYGPIWTSELPFNRWTKFFVDETAPENAAAGVAVITLHSKNSEGIGTMYVDDSSLGRRSGQLE